MWPGARIVAVMGVSVLLMGSKLIIRVPEGGSVVSSSGLFACAGGEVCTLEVDPRHFSETFTAEAAAGHSFEGWGGSSASLCNGSSYPLCDALDSNPFSGAGEVVDRFRSGSALTLEPSFAAATADGEQRGKFTLVSMQSTRYYRVPGRTQEEIWSQLTGAANPLALDPVVGAKPLGHASFDYSYQYESEYAEGGASCRVASGSLSFRFETLLPQLAEADSVKPELHSRWLSLQQAITEHEAGHQALYRELVTRLPRVMLDVGTAPCDELAERVRVAVSSAVGAVQQANDDYDASHGGETYAVSSL
jgi:predicted secreted Zn-dependent protease